MCFDKGISIIIPVYNSEKYLAECIDSLYKQTFKENLEYIFVLDKNSSDSSEEILEKSVKDRPNTKILKPKDGSGAGYNRNIAFEHVSKEYVGFHDSDDWSEPDFYEKLYLCADIYKADVVIGKTIIINDSDKNVFNTVEYPFSIEYFSGDVFQKLRLNTVWDKIYRTQFVLENNDIRFAEGIIHEDNIFVINSIYKANKIVFTPDAAYWWRRYPTSTSVNNNEKYLHDAYIALNQILDSLEKMDLPLADKDIVFKQVLPWSKCVFSMDENKRNHLKKHIKEVLGEFHSNYFKR